MEIKQSFKGLYCVSFSHHQQLAKTFMRFQEFYESPNPSFRGRIFSRQAYLAWYRKTYDTSYFDDWDGFNVPGHIFLPFYEGCFDPLTRSEQKLLGLLEPVYQSHNKFYVIGLHADHDAEIHETAHALYYLDYEYHREATRILLEAPRRTLSVLEKWLLEMGYCEEVLLDESQAYLVEEFDNLTKEEGLKVSRLMATHRRLKELFEAYIGA